MVFGTRRKARKQENEDQSGGHGSFHGLLPREQTRLDAPERAAQIVPVWPAFIHLADSVSRRTQAGAAEERTGYSLRAMRRADDGC